VRGRARSGGNPPSAAPPDQSDCEGLNVTSPRIERVAHLLQTEIATILDRELNNPNLPEFITVTHVKLSPDLSEAVVQFTFLEDQTDDVVRETVRELNRGAGYIRHLVSQRVYLKRHPHLKFVYNPSTRYALGMEPLFRQIQEELPAEDAPPDDRAEETDDPSGDSTT